MLFELTYDLKSYNTDRVFFSWPPFKDIDYPWRFGFDVVPQIWSSEISHDLGHAPGRPDEYRAGAQYLREWVDFRALVPMARTLRGRHIDPRIELRHLRLLSIGDNTEFFARGLSDLHKTNLGIGLSRQCGSFEGKVIYDGSFSWSIGFSTQINAFR